MNTYTDQLHDWYKNAEPITRDNLPNDGDTIIYPEDGGGYTIEPSTFGWTSSIVHPGDPVRILARAAKPTPAWHDAVAVVASTFGNGPQVWERCGEHWDGTAGDEAQDADLINPVPLIEARVTNEMVEMGARGMVEPGRAWDDIPDWRQGTYLHAARNVLNAALGTDHS